MIEAMKACGKRIVYLVLALALTVSLFGTAAFAEGDTPTNGYVLYLDNGNSIVWQYAQFSRLAPYAYYGEEEIEGESIVFGLSYNGSPFQSLYCTDLPTPAYGPANYRPLNLSDSTYAAAMANKLRGILLGTYPYITLDKLRSDSGIADLTLSEAITGSQMAIWKTAHGDIVTYSDVVHYVGYANVRESDKQKMLDSEGDAFRDADDAGKAAVNERIWKLYNYLLELESVEPIKPVVSAASFVSKSAPTVTVNEDGNCNVTVETTVNVSIESGDRLTLTAYLGDGTYFASQSLGNGTSSHTLVIKNVPADAAYGTVKLAIDGTQYLHDVYLIDAEGVRSARQSLVGALNHTLPVHAEVKAEPDRVLTIHKTADGSPLQNISFEIYYVGSVDDYRAGRLSIGAAPTEADIKEYAVTTNLVGTITTNASGYGRLNLSTEDGVYLVRELPNGAVSGGVAFFVSLPDWSRTDKNGNYPAYTITAEPKNTIVTEEVDIDKSVTEIDTKSDTFDVGVNHTWIIQSSIPETIATGKTYEVTDMLDTRLTLVSVGKVALAKDGGTSGNSENEAYEKDEDETPLGEEATVLTKDTDYTVEIGKTAAGEDTFTVSLTEAGRRKAGAAGENAELRIYFTAKINTSAVMGENIPNQAHVKYTNNLYRDYEADSDQPEVHTGGAVILKVDSNDKTTPLAGATFEVYRTLNDDEITDETTETIIINGIPYNVVKVSFYNTADMSGEKVTTLTTGADGKGYIYGLAYGEYYLVETKAPDGYNKLAGPVKITINENSHKTEYAVRVENTTGAVLPETGGIGTRAFVLGGAMLMLGACAAAVLLRRKERA